MECSYREDDVGHSMGSVWNSRVLLPKDKIPLTDIVAVQSITSDGRRDGISHYNGITTSHCKYLQSDNNLTSEKDTNV